MGERHFIPASSSVGWIPIIIVHVDLEPKEQDEEEMEKLAPSARPFEKIPAPATMCLHRVRTQYSLPIVGEALLPPGSPENSPEMV